MYIISVVVIYVLVEVNVICIAHLRIALVYILGFFPMYMSLRAITGDMTGTDVMASHMPRYSKQILKNSNTFMPKILQATAQVLKVISTARSHTNTQMRTSPEQTDHQSTPFRLTAQPRLS